MEKYKEIFRLKKMLEDANIPFEFKKQLDGYIVIIYNKNKSRLCDAREHRGSYGCEKDLLEIMGALTDKERQDDDVLGHLTAEEVFKRFKYCYEHNTSIYVDEEGD